MKADAAPIPAPKSTLVIKVEDARGRKEPLPHDDGMEPRMFGGTARLTASGGDFGFVIEEEDGEAGR